jgi:hypothetical protein
MAQLVYARLNMTMTTELREQADDITQQQVQEMEDAVDQEQEEGTYTVEEIEKDVYTHETTAMEQVKIGIDAVGDELQASMQSRARQIEKEILEERLSKLLNYKVKLQIVDEQITGVDDALLQGLQHFQPYNNNNNINGQQQQQYGQQPYGQQQQYGNNAYGNNGYNPPPPPPQNGYVSNANPGYNGGNGGGAGGTQYGGTRGGTSNQNQYAGSSTRGTNNQYGANGSTRTSPYGTQQPQQQQTNLVDLDGDGDNDDV